jgi:hypothetical protein
MPESAIPSFDPGAAARFLDTVTLHGVRHGQTVLDLAWLCRMRRVECVPATDPDLLAYQKTLWSHLSPIMDGQRPDGAWQPLERDRAGWFDTTPWILAFLGYLGLNGTAHPGLRRAAGYFVETLAHGDHPTYACRYALFLPALLELGFGERGAPAELRDQVRRACETHLDWTIERRAHCRVKTRRGLSHCLCATVKELLFLNAFPLWWRTERYERAVHLSRTHLLGNLDTLSHCPSQGRQWSEFGCFRHVCPDWFEALAALVGSGCRDRDVPDPMLARIGAACVDGATWICGYRAHRSVILDGKRRTVSWSLDLEPVGEPSPWLAIRALEISAALDAP